MTYDESSMPNFRIVIAGLVSVIWAVGYVLNYVNPKIYSPPNSVTPLMLIVVGFLLARETIVVLKNGKDKNG